MLSTDSVWNRREMIGESISDAAYNMTIGLVLTWGFAVNFLMVKMIPAEPLLAINQWVFLGVYLVAIIAGTMIYSKSDNPVISFAGYNLLVVPLGLVLVRFLYFFDAAVISQAFMTTALVTGVMMVLSMSFPQFFLSIGRGLFIGFIVAFIAELVVWLVTGSSPPIFDWAFVLIFSGYIGYDWARAQSLPRTHDNAVDAAAALYVDIVLLFMRLVRIFGRSR